MSPRHEVLADGVELWCGDCRDAIPEIAHFDAVITDPPYGVAYQRHDGSARVSAQVTNDGTRASLKLYRAVVPMLGDGPILWFTRWDVWLDAWDIFVQYKRLRGLLVWDKGTPGMGDLSHWGLSYEMIVSAGDFTCRGGRDNSVLRFNGASASKRSHPMEKPVDLMRYLVEKVTDAGHVVLDPFMGSGTTGVAAVATGRRFVGIEVDEAHFSTSCRRISQALNASRNQEALPL